jgi:hypothetical protein
MSLFINARTIRSWAEATVARSKLPHVIRRLVWATLDRRDVQKIDFPAYESVQRPGFDGEVSCRKGNAWVPDGDSAWELSVESNVGGKANSDFDTRAKNTPADVRQKSTYVCLTARHWRDKKDWADEKRMLGEWKDVRAFDADDIEQWAETAPFGFIVWFGRQIGMRQSGVDDIAERWEVISRFSSRPLVPKVYLAGRDRSASKVDEWLNGPAAQLQIECRSPTEIADFFCAAVAAMQEDERERIESRTVIIRSNDAWLELRDGTTPSVLVVEPSICLPAQEIMRAVRNGNHVLVSTEPAFPDTDRGTELERASAFELQQALEECGYTPVQAEQFARSAGGSLAILKHRLAPSRVELPHWSQGLSSEVLAACLLLGGWSDSSVDHDAFAQIAGRPFAECEAELQLMASVREPLLLHAAGNWRLISKDHAWSLFQERVTPTALSAFEKLAVDILADDDPRYQLPEGQRLYANIAGHVPKYSETIKRHVAETLALLGAFGSKLQAAASIDVTSSVDRIVSSVLSPACTWYRWASIGSRLPLLAEASPRSFLNAVRSDLSKTDSELVTLLHEEEESLFGRCNHAGLLWALETLAWPKSLLPEVARSLLALASRDAPKGKWGNRPSSTLCEILLHWLPQTTATVEERIQVLDLLVQTDRNAAWPVLIKLLPQSTGGVSHPTHRPYWRDWANEWVKGTTTAESFTFMTATAERVVTDAGIDVDRWKQIFENIGRFPRAVHERLLDGLDSLCGTDISDANRRILSDELSKQVNRHRYFASSHWALPSETVDRLEGILTRLKPHNPVFRHAWLFADWPDRFFERGGDHSDNEAALETARMEALQEILGQQGFAGIQALLEQAQSQNVVGFALAKSSEDRFVADVLPAYLEGEPKTLDFAFGFIWARHHSDGWRWVDENLSGCETTTQKANFLRSLRFSRPVWIRAEEGGADVSRAYWTTCRAFNPQLESQDVETAVQKLIEHERAADTLDLLSMALHQKRELSPETLLGLLEALLQLSAERSQDQFQRLDTHELQSVIEELQGRDDIGQDRLIRIEWHFIRLLDGHSGHLPRTLHRYLSTSPEFFNEVLSCCYRSRNSEIEEEQDLTDHQRYMAEHAYHLLHDWSLVPGTEDDGSINEGQLREWCNEARRIAEESGRLEVCDSHIGQLFAQCKSEDSDGKWPCMAVRRVAMKVGTESLASGMACGIQNLRGAGFRASGGDQERTLADSFRAKADRVRFDSPFVAEILDSVAESYYREAKCWDKRDLWESR